MRGLIRVPAVVLSVMLAMAVQAQVDIRSGDGLRLDDGVHRDVGARAGDALVQLYWSLTDLSLEEQRQQTWGLSSKTKAALWTYNIERFLRDHPELSGEAQTVLRDGILLINMPAWLDIVPGSFGYELKHSALAEFKRRLQILPKETVHQVFIRLGTEPISVESVPKEAPPPSQNPPSVPRVERNACYCAGDWECLSTFSYVCYSSWCDWVIHCGLFNNEVCTGKCKEEDPG